MPFYLTDCARVVEDEIAAGAKQTDVAITYATAMRSAAMNVWEPDWPRLNRAILDRWSRAGLEKIKAIAHRQFKAREPNDG